MKIILDVGGGDVGSTTLNKPCCLILNKFEKKILRRHIHSEKYKYREYHAARLIQKIYRGYRCRQWLQHLHKMAIIIQKYIRRFLAQKKYYEFLEELLQLKLFNYYNDMAILIQKHYRGYLSRLHKYDYYEMREWIRLVVRKNVDLQEETTMYFHEERLRRLEDDNESAKNLCVYIALKLHHLLRTHQSAGVYSKKNSNTLSHVEQLLACLRFKNYNTIQRQYNKKDKEISKNEIENLYAKTINNPKLQRQARCEAHYRHRYIGTNEKGEILTCQRIGTRFKQGTINYPYVRDLSAEEEYCDKIILLSRKYDIIDHKKDFSLNTKIIEKPESIDEYIDALTNFCHLHKLMLK